MEERNEPIEDPTAATAERLRAALHRGAAPLDAAAELARRGDPEGARALAAAVAFADPAQVAALAGSEDPVVSDALATEAQRAKVLALIQRRWGAAAGLAVSCAIRTPGRPKDDPLRVALVASLAAMGAQDALAACAEAGAGAARAAARQELAGARR